MSEALPVPTVAVSAREPEVGQLTGLPLSKFATAELIARAQRAGCVTLWEYVALLEHEAGRTVENYTDPLLCADPTHDELLAYARHDDDCMKPITGKCSCGLDEVNR